MAANTKAKADRQDADTPEPAEKTVTVQGMKVTISTSAMKRIDVVEALDDLESGRNQFAIISVFKSVFGLEQYKAIKEHLAEKHEHVELEHMSEFFKASLKKAAPNS